MGRVRLRRRQPLRRAGRFVRKVARRLAARVEGQAIDAAQGISTAVAAAGQAGTRMAAAASATAAAAIETAGQVEAIYRVAVDGGSASARTRTLRARNRTPLPSLHALYPEASRLPVRSLGVLLVNVDEIAGTAVAGPDQRGSDFRPLPPFRSTNWAARWRRIQAAVSRMEPLPPVDLQKYDGRYWVVDGHNRIAAALYGGQVAVDAVVQELVAPGAPPPTEPVSLVAEMAEGAAIRTAATGDRTSLELGADRELRADREPILPNLQIPTAEPDDGATDGRGETERGEPGTSASPAEAADINAPAELGATADTEPAR